jgi:hypothetical protein
LAAAVAAGHTADSLAPLLLAAHLVASGRWGKAQYASLLHRAISACAASSLPVLFKALTLLVPHAASPTLEVGAVTAVRCRRPWRQEHARSCAQAPMLQSNAHKACVHSCRHASSSHTCSRGAPLTCATPSLLPAAQAQIEALQQLQPQLGPVLQAEAGKASSLLRDACLQRQQLQKQERGGLQGAKVIT